MVRPSTPGTNLLLMKRPTDTARRVSSCSTSAATPSAGSYRRRSSRTRASGRREKVGGGQVLFKARPALTRFKSDFLDGMSLGELQSGGGNGHLEAFGCSLNGGRKEGKGSSSKRLRAPALQKSRIKPRASRWRIRRTQLGKQSQAARRRSHEPESILHHFQLAGLLPFSALHLPPTPEA